MPSLVVDLLMKTGLFDTDIKRAEAAVRKFRYAVSDIGKTMATSFAVGATASGVLFDKLAKGAAQYADLADMTGANAEAMASYAVAAATAGVSIDSVAGSMNKLTKNLTGVDDESKAAGAALKALGLNIEEFKQLDPAKQYEAVGKALNGFAEGSGKVQVAMALFGKSGAEQLKVFKALEDQSGRLTILTQKQIEQADEYADKQAKATAELLLYAQSAASQMTPAMTELTEVSTDLIKAMLGVDEATGKLGANNGLQDFAEAAASALAFVADAFQGIYKIVSRTGEFIGMTAAMVNASVGPKNAAPLQAIWDSYKESLDTNTFDSLQTRLQDARAKREAAAAAASRMQGPPSSLAGGKPKLPDVGDIAAKAKAAEDAGKRAADAAAAAIKRAQEQAKSYVDDLQQQIEKTQELSAVEQVAADVAAKRVTFSSAAQRAQADSLAAQIDATKLAVAAAKELDEVYASMQQDRQRAGEAAASEAESIIAANEALADEIALLGLNEQGQIAVERARVASAIATKQATLASMEAAGVTTAESAAIREQILALQERAGLLVQRAAADEAVAALKLVQDKAIEVQQSVEHALGDSLADALGGNFDDIGKRWASLLQDMVTRALAADLMAALTGKPGGNSDGLWKGIAGLFGAAAGSSSGFSGAPGQSSVDWGMVPQYATGTDYVPRDMLAMVHEGERITPKAFNPAIGGGAANVQIVNNGAPATATATQERGPDGRQLLKITLAAIKQDIAAGGQVGKALEGQYGLRRNLPRRA